jgi:hypothetical protein
VVSGAFLPRFSNVSINEPFDSIVGSPQRRPRRSYAPPAARGSRSMAMGIGLDVPSIKLNVLMRSMKKIYA